MSAVPPLLADETLARVLRHARSNGSGVMMVASVFALLAAVAGDMVPVFAWLLVAGTGAMTLHGGTLLYHGQSRGVEWLVGAQLFCLTFILTFCAWQWVHVDLAPLRSAMDADMQAAVKQAGLGEDEFLLLVYRAKYIIITVAALFYLGGMAAYYLKRREAVRAAVMHEVTT